MQDNSLAEFIDQRPAVSDADRFTHMALMVLDEPQNEAEWAVAASSDALMTIDLPPEVCDRALLVLASAIFTRPDLLDSKSVSSLLTVFRRADLPAGTFRLAAEVMNFLLTTSVAARAVEATVAILSQPNRPSDVYEALMGTLRHAVTWAKEILDLETLSGLSEFEHLSSHRDYLLREIVEPCIYAAGEAATTQAIARIAQLYGESDSFKYCLYNVKSRSDFRLDVRELASRLLQGCFSLHEEIARRLGSGSQRILVVQNLNDGQGDEIIRTVPLMQALLDFNPALEIILLTHRVYMYATPRITVIPFKDRDRITALLDQRFDAVIDFFEPTMLEVNRDPDLEPLIQDYVQRHRPFLFISSTNGFNHFVYEQIYVDSRPVTESLGLDRHRVKNIYETTLRLIAELGLPVRCGEDSPVTDWVLAGLPWNEAEAAWHELVRQNTEGRPVALLNPFGGAEPLKGYVERQIDKLSAMIRQLIRENFYVVLLPNGTPWGAASLAAEAIRRLEPHEQAQVVVGPGPARSSEAAPHTVPGAPALTHPDRVVRMVTYFIRFADLIVAVEGWVVHAAFCLGKKYRLLMMPYSYPDRWHPYAVTRHQQIALGLLQCADHSSEEESAAPPIPEQPRKFILLFLLREFGNAGDAQALELLRRAARSEDRDLRQAAALSLGKLKTAEVEQDLISLLQDPFRGVRADAASALLKMQEEQGARPGDLPREYLLVLVASGHELRNWATIISIGEAARPALELALQDDDPVVRREALQVKRVLDFKAKLRRRRPSLRTRLMRNRILRGIFGRG
jgi:ADP-heptose:LPS heptosyltransferase